jgi:hypothetical protein
MSIYLNFGHSLNTCGNESQYRHHDFGLAVSWVRDKTDGYWNVDLLLGLLTIGIHSFPTGELTIRTTKELA